jgi:hypothetical protein
MAFFRFNRDKRGYEYFYLVEPITNRRGKSRPRILYWYRTPPNIKVGRAPFDAEVQRALEAQNPNVVFDWRKIIDAPIPSADVEKWRERRRVERAEKAARRAAAVADAAEAPAAPAAPVDVDAEDVGADDGPEIDDAGADDVDGVAAIGDDAPPNEAGTSEAVAAAPGANPGGDPNATRKRRRRRRRRGRRSDSPTATGYATEPASAIEPASVTTPEPATEPAPVEPPPNAAEPAGD